MRKQLKKLSLMILLPVMVIAPFQGASIATDMSSMQEMDQMHMLTMQNALSSDTERNAHECDQCKQEDCCENHMCTNGQCFSSSAMMLSNNDYSVEFLIQTEFTLNQSHVVFSLPSPLFRPPRV